MTDFKAFFLTKYPYFFACNSEGHLSFLSTRLKEKGLKLEESVLDSFVLIEGPKQISITIEELKSRVGKVINLRAKTILIEFFGELEFDNENQCFIFLGLKENFLSHSLYQKTILELVQLAIFPIENPNPILRIDHEGNLCFSNEFGTHLWESLQEDLQQKSDIIRQAITTLDDRKNDSIQLTVNDRIYDATFVPDPGQNFVGIYFTDITKKIENERALETQKSKLVAASRLSTLGEMASGIAHEINNPMAVIMARSRILQKMLDIDSIDKEKFKSYILQIEKMGDRISKIIKGLRSFARDGEQDPMEEINLKQCLENVLSLCEERITALQIEFKCDEVPSVNLKGRAVQIEQVLLNLIMNSTQAIQDDTTKWIQVSFQKRKNQVLIHIIDSGAGISEKVEKKLMQPFFTTKAVGSGTGLGLSISLGIIQSHGGKLYLNRNFVNTCFTIELPSLATAEQIDNKLAS